MVKEFEIVDIDKLRFNEKGLIPVVVQDWETDEVLMLAYMNRKSLRLSIETGETWFFSRSRDELWHKGESSGNTQKIVSIQYDCDEDTLLFKVIPSGPACHTGNKSCFYRQLSGKNLALDKKKDIIGILYELIKKRKNNPIEGSYTCYLFKEGVDKILKKVGEEAAEVIIASKNPSKEEFIYEVADLIYHLLVLMLELDCTPEDIKNELSKRYKKET